MADAEDDEILDDDECDDGEEHLHLNEKEAILQRHLGPMHDIVGHAIIPYCIGGAVDMYYFKPAIGGTAFATMELIDGNGPAAGNIGPYELVAFTKHTFESIEDQPFSAIERRMCGIFTTLGSYGTEAILDPMQTCESYIDEDTSDEMACVFFDSWKAEGQPLSEGEFEMGLLLIVEVHRDEMEYARENGTAQLVDKLKQAGYYPFSDLDRPSVA